LAILRDAVDKTEKIHGEAIANSDDIKSIISIVETFIKEKRLLCYGGTAINNILPPDAQFYDHAVEIPDYDFYSDRAIDHAKELADIYYKQGYTDVEAKAGVHQGTFKVFVNFIPIADITQLHKSLYRALLDDAITVDGILYAPPDFLRMSMYLELSRPAGDVSRWEKVLKRLTLLNTHFPLRQDVDCATVKFQQPMDSDQAESERLYTNIRDVLISHEVVFFGGYATSLYAQYMPPEERRLVEHIPDFDVIVEDPDACAADIKTYLGKMKVRNVRILPHDAIGEIIPYHVELRVGKETVTFLYKPIACHSYNVLAIDGKDVRIATIDTILSLYLSFLYSDMPYYNKDRLLCMATFLFDVEQQNRLAQKGLLKRFSIQCYGKQPTLATMRSEKAQKFRELKNQRGTEEYESWFLKYVPSTLYGSRANLDSRSRSPVKKTKRRTAAKKKVPPLFSLIQRRTARQRKTRRFAW
jgi:hypothetical protein